MTYRTISFTPKGELAETINTYCSHPEHPTLLMINPQDLVRDSLVAANVIPKKQLNAGDRSNWKIGDSIKTSFFAENANALIQFAKEQGMSRQDVIREAVRDYINSRQSCAA